LSAGGGRNGATGNHAARQLLARGLPVRAFVRQADDRADELGALGAEFDAVTDVVQAIGGAPPKSLEAFIRQNATVFGASQDAALMP
jgi:hypothetical protein